VSREEIDYIFLNIGSKKRLNTFAEAGHENYLNKYKEDWMERVSEFLNDNMAENE
jgi:uncharacterized protein